VWCSSGRVSGCIRVGGLVEPLDEITSALEFYREVEGGRDVHSLEIDASLVSAARVNLAGPERKARRIRLAIQEVVMRGQIIDIVNRFRAGSVRRR
jgi:hypothetical protein